MGRRTVGFERGKRTRGGRGGALGVAVPVTVGAVFLAAVFLALPVLPGVSPLGPTLAKAQDVEEVERGREVHMRWCAECHGYEGGGDGPAADRMLPRPRDFTGARYKIRRTATGELPSDEDLMRAITEGLPGTDMPGFPNLRERDRRALVAYIKSLSPFFEAPEPRPAERIRDPGVSDELLEQGREAYEVLECYRCHGREGRGDGESTPTLEDWRDLPNRPADLTKPWRFRGGHSPEEIHMRILNGLEGTPMPAHSDALDADVVTGEQLWGLAHYVRSLGPDRVPPRVRDAIRATWTEADLPTGPDDEAWEDVRKFYVPMAAQTIEQPRSFSPTVRGLWVQAVHDGEELALRILWSDPSRSPDPAWDEWQEMMAATMYDDGIPISTEPLPDALAVQFPREVPDGRRLPYFLMGDRRSPAQLWRWDSETGVYEARATGLGTSDSLNGETGVTGEAVWERGQWRLTLRRSLDPEDGGPTFREAEPVPMGFFAWDGSSGEDETRGSVSTWYYLVLEEPPSRAVVVVPLIAMVLTAVLGAVVTIGVRRRREKRDIADDGARA